MFSLLLYVSILPIDPKTNLIIHKLKMGLTVSHQEIKELRRCLGCNFDGRFDIKLAKLIGYENIYELFHEAVFQWKWNEKAQEYTIDRIIK